MHRDVTGWRNAQLRRLYDKLPVKVARRLDDLGERARRMAEWLEAARGRADARFKYYMPKGLYARALLIIIVPMVLLQSVVAFVFMERHWNTVTRRLSSAVVQDIAALIDVYSGYPQDKDRATIRGSRSSVLGWWWISYPSTTCPPPGTEAVFLAARSGACRSNCASASGGRSGSTRSATRRWSKSASSSTIR